MVRRKELYAREGRPHANSNDDDVQHRELLTSGPAETELKIRASPYQHLACGSSKRKAESLAVDSSAESSEEVQQNANGESGPPVKALKMIHHRFSNGQPVNKKFSGFEKSNTGAKSTSSSQELQSGEENEALGSSPSQMMYQETQSQKWTTKKRQPRKSHIGSDGRRQQGSHLLMHQAKSTDYADSPTPEPTSEHQTVTCMVTEDGKASNEGVIPAHLCTGPACDHSGFDFTFEHRSLASASIANEPQLELETITFGRSFRTNLGTPNNHSEFTNIFAPGNLKTTTSHLHQPLLMSIREMAANHQPELHFQSQFHISEAVEAENVDGKTNPVLIKLYLDLIFFQLLLLFHRQSHQSPTAWSGNQERLAVHAVDKNARSSIAVL
jgi:hypothetical protein